MLLIKKTKSDVAEVKERRRARKPHQNLCSTDQYMRLWMRERVQRKRSFQLPSEDVWPSGASFRSSEGVEQRLRLDAAGL